jgi:DNA invertase Pin-like site-specific DNA recombinase
MSTTDLQKYSTENQLETIRRYAEQRGFTIVHVFEDSGRSGLRIDDRDGLQSLMLKVQSGIADFQAILVYDVSRWGRFPARRIERDQFALAAMPNPAMLPAGANRH